MKLLKQHVRILIVIVIAAAVVVAGSIYTKNRVSHPVWNSVRVDDSAYFQIGEKWDQLKWDLVDVRLDPNEGIANIVPTKDGKRAGVSMGMGIKDEKVTSISYRASSNESDCVVYLADMRIDQTNYTDLVKIAGEEEIRKEVEDEIILYWSERDKALLVHTDLEGNVTFFRIFYNKTSRRYS